MATLSTAGRNAACNAITGLLGATATFRLQATGPSTLATFSFNATAFGAAAVGVATAGQAPILSTTASATGTAALWDIRTSAPAVLLDGTIGTLGPPTTDLTIDNTSIVLGQTLNITALTITVPAS